VRSLILGGGGQLASDLESLLGAQARAFSHAQLDICDPMAVDRAYRDVQPDVVFNCAAFHNVDMCEREREQAWLVNVEAVQQLATRSVPLVHLSTNYVFDGRREQPYGERDLPSPRSIYALTKLAGEYAALAYGSRTLVVRSAGLYGLHGSASKGGSFVHRMIARAREQGSLQIVSDQRLQPTATADLAAAILAAVEKQSTGIVHLTAAADCSWFEFTRAIMELAGIDVPIEPITTTVAPDAADRPLNGVLARPRADELGIPELRPWRAALQDFMTHAGFAAQSITDTGVA
jgi:dTDP-4-dehydrorhamnose reductase